MDQTNINREVVRLLHIRDAIVKIEDYAAVGYERFLAETMTQDAILRQLELTSEATKHLSAEFHERHPEFASNRLCELQDECDRNLLNIDPHFAWDVTQETLPQIKGRVETILNEDQTGQNRVNQARFFKHDENRGPSMATNALVSDNRAEILRIATEHGATRVRILGSFARGTARLDSDVDLLIELAPGRHLMELIAIKQDLEDLGQVLEVL